MRVVNMLDAKTSLSKLVADVESGQEEEVVIARHGLPAARLVPVDLAHSNIRLGLAKDALAIPDDFDELDASVSKLFFAEP